MSNKKRFQAKTQKARGLEVLAAITDSIPLGLVAPNIHAILPYDLPEKKEFPFFARPCPIQPRHGFVESRIVNNSEELLNAYIEARAADGNAEVICMPKLSGKVSGIATQAGMVWALGHDGATAGKGKQVIIPAPSPELTETVNYWVTNNGPNHYINAPGILAKYNHDTYRAQRDFQKTYTIPTSVYLEVVEEKGKVAIVQMRDGPVPPMESGDYVPRSVQIGEFIDGDPNGDLLEWEKKIREAPANAVVRLRNGNLSSHLAVHAIARKLPVLTSEEAIGRYVVGNVLNVSKKNTQLERWHYKVIAKHLDQRRRAINGHCVLLSCAVMHSMSYWDGEEHLLRLRAIGAEIMARALVAACAGEARHYYRSGPGCDKSLKRISEVEWARMGLSNKLTWSDYEKAKGDAEKWEMLMATVGPTRRDVVLSKASRFNFRELDRLSGQVVEDLHAEGWGGQSGGSENSKRGATNIGGQTWAQSAEVARDLLLALRSFKRQPCEEKWLRVVEHYNKGVNCAHNNGHVLDKWCRWARIDAVCNNPVLGFMSREAMREAGDILKVSLQEEEGLNYKYQAKCGDEDCRSCPQVRIARSPGLHSIPETGQAAGKEKNSVQRVARRARDNDNGAVSNTNKRRLVRQQFQAHVGGLSLSQKPCIPNCPVCAKQIGKLKPKRKAVPLTDKLEAEYPSGPNSEF